ncbi:putative glutathione S-transferase [Xylogone sp. PMI_703]|nr:putative glutathione S-transferase [Xylogone sp. PMI_703]
MTSLKPIILYSHSSGPNPWKAAPAAEEPKAPYEMKFLEFVEMKKPAYEKINPNGRVPAIEDPNTYDLEKKFSFLTGTPEYFYAKQWLYFQTSGQGPYFGQAAWFKLYHPEKIQSAIDRYVNEIVRVSSVLNGSLEGREWLVGEKYSYVDVAFLPWFEAVPFLAGERINLEKDFPNLHAWLSKIKARPAVAKILKDRAVAKILKDRAEAARRKH